MEVSENLRYIKSQIESACERSGRNPEEITIIAVTKYVDADRTQEAVKAGITHLGENRDEGLLAKWEILKDKPVWHFIGTLQSRKVKNVINKIDYLHSLDRFSLAKEINKRTEKPLKCLVQVNVSGEESKHGIEPSKVLDFIKSLEGFKNIRVSGLMTMAPHIEDEEALRECFRSLKKIQSEVQELNLVYAPCKELSMGMSNDFGVAVEEGATMIRIGTALVGMGGQ
ncbi:YggS family pyridoxal phosphate-dependent enzyme [Mesobacillus harenae]|uniref:YggS family pyridoxal phosphate-dependent enzyme n=1 Tax=Mesobacillus harenae TaxID=2213203 RepID=UPI0015802625|nr:YggS family pyridoxal phosphate-dependent enzyme [Mesobacillus harenae]